MVTRSLSIAGSTLLFCVLVSLVGHGDAWSAEIKNVDFNNFTYQPECTERKPVTVRNGTFETPENVRSPQNYIFFKVLNIIYGDLTNDGHDEAVILTLCNTGGSGVVYDGVIYGMRKNRPAILSWIEGGDRTDGGIIDVTVKDGLLLVDRATSAQSACSQNFTVEVTKFRLNGNQLVKVGKAEHREPSPTEKTKFCSQIPTKPTGKSSALPFPRVIIAELFKTHRRN